MEQDNNTNAQNETLSSPVNTSEQVIAKAPAPQTPPTPDSPHKSPNSKPLIVTTIICAILAVAGVAFGIYGMFLKPEYAGQPETDQIPTSVEQTEESTATSNEEVEITDAYVLRDLDEKIALLHFTNQTGPTLVFQNGLRFEFPLYQNGTLSDEYKLMGVIGFLGNNVRQIYPAERDTIATDFSLSENEKQALHEIVNADTVDQKYIDVFGEKPIRNINISKAVCGAYYYDDTLNSYFDLAGCGGTSPYASYYYKTKYTKDNNRAYVYIQTAILNYENGNIYCDAGNFESENAELCGRGTQESYGYTFTEDDVNRDSLATYRFVFNKADNDTYYFDKVEKV